MRTAIGAILVTALLALAALPGPARADNVWVVDTTDWDLTLTKTACSPVVANDCSYRGAMFGHVTVNGTAVKDVISFDPAVFPPGAPATIQQASGGMTTVSNLTIDGAGAGVIWRGVNPGLGECIALDGSDIAVRNLEVTNCFPAVWLWGTNNTYGPGLVISDSLVGIRAQNGSSMRIIGNRVGTNAAGTALHPSGPNTVGIQVTVGTDITIGGPAVSDRNVVSGNGVGIEIEGVEGGIVYPSNDNDVINNFIGTDVTGTVDLGNSTGVRIGSYASGNVIGGGPGEGNLISGNTAYNVLIQGATATNNTVTRNKIGIDANGSAGAISNGDGVSVVQGASGNTIGPRNVISNNYAGVALVDAGTESNTIRANFIGTTTTGLGIIPNNFGVIAQVGARNNMIGGTAPSDGNVIAGNSSKGVLVYQPTAVQNSIRSNSIYGNGPTDDPGDQIDNLSGGNTELPPPSIDFSDGLMVRGTACPNCEIDVFSGTINNPRFFEGTTTAGGGGHFTYTSASPFAGRTVMATATDLDGNTSQVGDWLISDQDGDGLNDALDTDDDGDTVLDVNDQCAYSMEDLDGWEDGNGCPDPDNDGDGVCDAGQSVLSCVGTDTGKNCFDPAGTLSCPMTDCRNLAEDIDGFKDGDGCPEPDNDNDSFPDATDACAGADASAGVDGMFGAPQDANHNGIRDGAEAAFTTDDVMPLLMFEDKDGVLDTDGCHDSPGADFDGDGLTDDAEVFTHLTDAGNPDTDADAVIDGTDNCPNWANTPQNLPAWTIPANDSDCDGWNVSREQWTGTDPAKHCNNTAGANDEPVDAWPSDFNDSRVTNLSDVVLMGPAYNQSTGTDPAKRRFDLNASGAVNLSDVVLMGPFYNKSCG
jgi:hypothetical protein